MKKLSYRPEIFQPILVSSLALSFICVGWKDVLVRNNLLLLYTVHVHENLFEFIPTIHNSSERTHVNQQLSLFLSLLVCQ